MIIKLKTTTAVSKGVFSQQKNKTHLVYSSILVCEFCFL